MTWTYGGDPSANDRDAVRFLLGDTDINNQLVQDEEIDWLISQHEDIYWAAAGAAETLSSKYSSAADSKSADGLSISNNLSQKYTDLASRLRILAASRRRLGKPYAGGLSRKERQLDDADHDLYHGHFRSELHDIDNDNGTSGIESSWDR